MLDAARAAALAAHAAAGLATAASSQEAARLLRSAEALARSASAVLDSAATTRRPASTSPRNAGFRAEDGGPPDGAGGGTTCGNVTPATRRRRRRRSKKKKQTQNEKIDVDEECRAQAVTSSRAVTSSLGAGDGTSGLGVAHPRRLVRHETLPHSAPSSSPSAALAPKIGTLGTLCGLVARPELNGLRVCFLRVDDACGRFIVEPVVGGDAIQIKPEAFLECKEEKAAVVASVPSAPVW